MLAEACLQTLANGLLLFCFHVHQPQNRNVAETWKCPVYIIELPSRKHFSASFAVVRTSTNIQGCYQHLTYKARKMTNSDKMNVAIIYLQRLGSILISVGVFNFLQQRAIGNWGIGMSANDLRGRWSEWSGTCEIFLKNQGNTKETMSSSKQSITNI